MTCNAIYRQKARIKSKTSVAQTSQTAVYVKGLTLRHTVKQKFRGNSLVEYR
jgi:hypothetical protein